MEVNNPAMRLFTLLSALKANPRGNQQTQKVLADVFGVEDTPTAVMRCIVQMHELLDEVFSHARQSNGIPSASLLKYRPHLETALAITNLEAGWQAYKDRISTECLVVLDIAAHAENVVQDSAPTTEDISELEESLQELFNFVHDSKLDPEFRRFVLEQVERIRRCLAEYRIAGAQGFERYLESLIGQTVRHAAMLKRQNEEAPEAVGKLKKVVAQVAKFVALTGDGIKFLRNTKEVFSDGVGLLEDFSEAAGSAVPELGGVDSP